MGFDDIDDLTGPPPLSPFEDEIISEANRALEERTRLAETLRWTQRRRLRSRLRQIQGKLLREDYNALRSTLLATIDALRAEMAEMDGDERDAAVRRAHELHRRIEPLRALAKEHASIVQRLGDHKLAVERNRLEARLKGRLRQEVKLFERIIQARLTRLGLKHEYERKGKTHIKRVQFAVADYSLDSIYYEVDGSYKTLGGGYDTNVPDGIYIVRDILSPDVLDELTLACKRQTVGMHNQNGAWIVVHRLESHDGLLNYVTFEDVAKRWKPEHAPHFPVCVGVGQNRTVKWVRLSEYPHWLIAGLTGGGKSNFINQALAGLITKYTPASLRLMLNDMKGGLEFSYYEGLPHLHGKIAEDINAVEFNVLALEAIMRDRFSRFRGVAKSLSEYQAKRPDEYMPRILMIFDEIASIDGQGAITRRIRQSLSEIVRMGRAVGINCWLCTQRPEVKIIEGQIKGNLSVTLSARQRSAHDSMTVFGNSAAATIAPVTGRMMLGIGPDPEPVQTPHITADMLDLALAVAMAMEPAGEIGAVNFERVMYRTTTEQDIIKLSLKHLDGSISATKIWSVLKDEGNLTRQQVFDMVEAIWAKREVEHDGQRYVITTGRSNTRWLKPDSESPKIHMLNTPALAGD